MKKWHNKFFWASILIEQRIGPPGNFIEFCTKSFCLLTLSLSLFNNFLGLTLKSNKFLLLKKLQLRFPTQSTVPPKLLIILIKAKLCIPSLQKETVFKQLKICVMKSRLADQRLNPRLFYRNVFGIFAGWRPNCKHRSWSFATCATLAWWPGQSYYGWDTNLHLFSNLFL